jgi:hypothetical protein
VLLKISGLQTQVQKADLRQERRVMERKAAKVAATCFEQYNLSTI